VAITLKQKKRKVFPSAEGGLSFSLSSGKGKKQQKYPQNPVNPV
jgi:hypothetical protein